MSFSFRNALREIRNNRPFCLFYLLNLSLGLVGFIGVNSFKSSLDQKVESESKELLGADLAIRARRDFTTEELKVVRKVLPENTKEAKAFDFFSMVAGPEGRSRLIKVIAIDPGFPFYGGLKTRLSRKLNENNASMLHERPVAWIYPELKSQLDLDLGEELKLGEASFRVTDYVLDDAGLTFQPAELAPKAFISTKYLNQTQLLSQGNTAFRNFLFKLPPNSNLSEITKSLDQAVLNPEIRVYSHQRVGHRAGRLLRYLSDFLAIVSMVALFLACLGSGYLYHGFINQKIQDIAILVSMGATKSEALRPYFAQLFLLGISAVIPSVVLCMFVIPALSGALGTFVPIEVQAHITLSSVVLATIVAIFGGWLIALPSLWKIRCLQPADLFRESSNPGTLPGNKFLFLFTLPGVLAFWLLCLLQTDSMKLANIFFISLLVSIFLLYLFVRFGLWILNRFASFSALTLRLATRSLVRNRTSTSTGFLALGTGVLLLNLIPQFQYILENEIGSTNQSANLPKLFLFDIQDEQLNELCVTLESEGKPLKNLTPWVRGKLLEVKGRKYERDAKEEEEIRNPSEERRNNFRNRSFNLSYRDHLLESEQIIRGRMVAMNFDPNSSKPAEISVAAKYADSMDLDIGDRMVIEVSGVPIEAEIVNLRRVKWTSFQPNFFVQMQPGVLEDAPKTYIGTVHEMDSTEKERIQDLLVRKFPTISILDVERTGKKVLEIVSQMTWALQLMASLSIFAGIIVLYTLAKEKARQQRWELNLLKILGASFSDLRVLIRVEFGLLAFTASLLGILLSLTTSYFLAEKIFDRVWSFHPTLPLSVLLGVTLISLIITEIATRNVLKEKPNILLGDR